MKIVFWSPESGKCSTTSALIAIASQIALAGTLKCCLLSVNSKERIQTAFMDKVSEDLFMQSASSFGMDALLRDNKASRLSSQNILDAAISLSNKFSLYISSTDKDHKIIQKNLVESYEGMVKALNNQYDLVFIDTSAGNSAFNQKVLASADLIVICLNQNTILADEVFNSGKYNFAEQNCLFLVSNYDSAIGMNVNNFRKRYKECRTRNSAVIPHCPEYADALNKGTAFKWISTIQHEKKFDLSGVLNPTSKNSTTEFSKEVNKAAVKLLKLIKLGGSQ